MVRVTTVDGIKLAYEEQGTGDPPLVLIHGFGATMYSWEKVAEGLADSHRSIRLDLMGYGGSDKPRDDELYTLDRQAALVQGFIANMELCSPVIIGHSYGGAVCLELVRQARDGGPAGPSAIVLVDPLCYLEPFPWFIRRFIKALQTPIIGPSIRAIIGWIVLSRILTRAIVWLTLAYIYNGCGKIRRATVDEYVDATRAEGAHEALVATAKHIIPENVEALKESYSRIAVPTLVLWGERDRLFRRRQGEQLATTIHPEEGAVVIPDCGHAPQEEWPTETIRKIREFLGAI